MHILTVSRKVERPVYCRDSLVVAGAGSTTGAIAGKSMAGGVTVPLVHAQP